MIFIDKCIFIEEYLVIRYSLNLMNDLKLCHEYFPFVFLFVLKEINHIICNTHDGHGS